MNHVYSNIFSKTIFNTLLNFYKDLGVMLIKEDNVFKRVNL